MKSIVLIFVSEGKVRRAVGGDNNNSRILERHISEGF